MKIKKMMKLQEGITYRVFGDSFEVDIRINPSELVEKFSSRSILSRLLHETASTGYPMFDRTLSMIAEFNRNIRTNPLFARPAPPPDSNRSFNFFA